MANKTKTKADETTADANAYEAAVAARRDAEQCADAAREDVAQAQRRAAELRQRIASGDATVTGGELSAADGDVERAELLHVAAQTALREARQRELPQAAQHVADLLAPVVERTGVSKAQERARRALAAAFSELADRCAQDADTITRATTMAREAGVRAAHGHRVGMVPQLGRRGTEYVLTLDGQRVTSEREGDVIADVIVDALAAAGWRIAERPTLERVAERERHYEDSRDYGPSWAELERAVATTAEARKG